MRGHRAFCGLFFEQGNYHRPSATPLVGLQQHRHDSAPTIAVGGSFGGRFPHGPQSALQDARNFHPMSRGVCSSFQNPATGFDQGIVVLEFAVDHPQKLLRKSGMFVAPHAAPLPSIARWLWRFPLRRETVPLVRYHGSRVLLLVEAPRRHVPWQEAPAPALIRESNQGCFPLLSSGCTKPVRPSVS